MDDLFWQQAFPGNKDELLAQVEEQAKEFTVINCKALDLLLLLSHNYLVQ